jgi:hypothetical protein
VKYSDPSGYSTDEELSHKADAAAANAHTMTKGEAVVFLAVGATIATVATGGIGSSITVPYTLTYAGGGTLTISATEIMAAAAGAIGGYIFNHQNNNTVMFSKGGKKNVKHEDFKDKSNQWVQDEYDKLTGRLTKEEKQYKIKLKQELKGRDEMNQQKRLSD